MLGLSFLTLHLEVRPRRNIKEWIAAFIENDEAAYWEEVYEARDGDQDLIGSRRLESEHHDDGYYDELEFDIDDGMLEGLLIVGLVATLLVLVYIRQQQQRNRQNEDAANQGNANGNGNWHRNANAEVNDRGFFPRPGDPEFAQWVAGGVGH